MAREQKIGIRELLEEIAKEKDPEKVNVLAAELDKCCNLRRDARAEDHRQPPKVFFGENPSGYFLL
jgi:hypothetical protein